EHPAQHRAGDHRVHLQVDDLAVAQADRNGVGFKFDSARKTLDNRRLPDARLANEHDRVRPFAMTEDLQNLLTFLVAPEYGRHAVLPGQQVQIRREMLEEGRELEALFQPFFAQLEVAHPRVQPVDEHFGFDAVASEYQYGNALGFLEYCRKKV